MDAVVNAHGRDPFGKLAKYGYGLMVDPISRRNSTASSGRRTADTAERLKFDAQCDFAACRMPCGHDVGEQRPLERSERTYQPASQRIQVVVYGMEDNPDRLWGREMGELNNYTEIKAS